MYSEEGNEAEFEHYSDSEEVYEDATEEENEREETGREGVEQIEEVEEEQEEQEQEEELEPIGEAGNSLLERLWDTKVVEWDSSLEPERINNYDEEVDVVRVLKQGDDSALRHSALLLQCDAFGEMSTEIILKLLSGIFEQSIEPIQRPEGLEWIDDETVVILWGSEFGPRHAFLTLVGSLLDESDPLIPVPCNLGFHNATVRLALASDVKRRGAAAKSQFYRKRQELRQPYSTSGRPNRSRREDLDAELDQMRASSSTSVQDLDAELDAMAKNRDEEL